MKLYPSMSLLEDNCEYRNRFHKRASGQTVSENRQTW